MKKTPKQRVLPKTQLALEQCIFVVELFRGVTLHDALQQDVYP
jgi:hypothetical protein